MREKRLTVTRLNAKFLDATYKRLAAGQLQSSGAAYILRDVEEKNLYVRSTRSDLVFCFYGWDSHDRIARSIKLGTYEGLRDQPNWLTDVRDKARELRGKTKRREPLVDKPDISARLANPAPEPDSDDGADADETMDKLFARYFESLAFKSLKAGHPIRQAIELRFLNYPSPKHPRRFGNRQASEFDRKTLSTWREDLADESKNDARKKGQLRRSIFVSNRALAYVMAGIGWLTDNGHVSDFPRLKVEKEPPSPRTHLPNEQLRALWRSADKLEDEQITAIIRLLILTGQRFAAIGGARKSEITVTQDGMKWLNVPIERSKGGFAYRVPLCDSAWAILRPFAAGAEDCFFVRASGKYVSELSTKRKLVLEECMRQEMSGKLETWHLHSVRKNFSNALDTLKVNPYVREAMLGHRLPFITGSEDAYLTKDFGPEMADAIKKFERFILQLCEGNGEALAKIEAKREHRPLSISDLAAV